MLERLKQILDFAILQGSEYQFTIGSLLFSFVVLAITKWVLYFGKKVLIKKSSDWKTDGKRLALYQIASYIIWAIVFVSILQSHGLNLTILVAGSTALMVGVGLGLQQSFNDLVSGILLLFERTIQVGDVVEVDSVVGRVQAIGLRTSKITTRDHIVMIVPNSKFISERVINWSHNDYRTRFNVPVGVAYGSDTALVRKVLLECARECEGITNTPAPFVRFESFGDSCLDFKLYFWNEDVFFVEDSKSQLRFLIDQKFKEHDLEIPFPQRDLHIRTSIPLNDPPN